MNARSLTGQAVLLSVGPTGGIAGVHSPRVRGESCVLY